MSPVVVVNKLPYTLKYKYNKEEIDVLETIQSAGRYIRKRSMQATPMQSVLPLEASRHREVLYSNISDMEVCIDDYYVIFSLGNMIEGIKQAHLSNFNQKNSH